MRVIALLGLIFGFMMQMLLDGQIFTHAVIGIVCGVAAVGCGLASSRKHPRYRWEGWIMAGLGFALGVWCIVMLPHTYERQEKFNDRTRKYREKMERQNAKPNHGVEGRGIGVLSSILRAAPCGRKPGRNSCRGTQGGRLGLEK